jgi:hypothetical protein
VPTERGIRGKARRIEAFRIRPAFGVTMHGIGARHQDAVGWNPLPAEVDWVGHGAHDDLGGRVASQCLLEDHPGRGQTRRVIASGRPPKPASSATWQRAAIAGWRAK